MQTINIHSASYRSNPHRSFRQLRESRLICRTEPYGHWLVTDYLSVRDILKNYELFSSASITQETDSSHPEFFLNTRGLVGMDPPHHCRIRRLLRQAFTRVAIQSLEPNLRQTCQALIKNLTACKTVNIIDSFATPLPIVQIADLLGFARDYKVVHLKNWIDLLLNWRRQAKISEALTTSKSMSDYFNQIIEAKKKQPGEDLISTLIHPQLDNHTPTTRELLAIIRLLLVAGTDTTTNLIANGIYFLATHPDIMYELQQKPMLIPNFIEELLRYDSPVICLMRKTTQDVVVAKTKVNKGEIVLPAIASANHDAAFFSQPDVFNLMRRPTKHLTFGSGIHYCLGVHLARLQVKIAFEELLMAFNRFTISKKSVPKYGDAFFFRGIKNLYLDINH